MVHSATFRKTTFAFTSLMFFCLEGTLWSSDQTAAFLQDAQSHWQQYANFVQTLESSMTIISRSADTGEGGKSSTLVKRSTECYLSVVEMTHNFADGTSKYREGEVIGQNPQYVFTLRKTVGNGPWKLIKLAKPTPSTEKKEANDGFLMVTGIQNQTLPKLAKQPGFRVVVYERSSDNNIKVQFRWDLSGYPDRRLEGHLVLDPEHCWCVRSAETQDIFQGKVTTKTSLRHEYESNQGLPLARSRSLRSWFLSANDPKPENIETIINVVQKVPDPLPPNTDFTLSAFGLTEPPGVTWERPTPWYLWASGIAFACLIIGFVSKRIAGRFRTAA
jgi:hypothetical protein